MSRNRSLLSKISFLILIVELGITNNVHGMLSVFKSKGKRKEAYQLEDASNINAPLLESNYLNDHSESEKEFNLGVCYEFGCSSIEKNETEAIKWYKRAAIQGHSIAQFNLGVCCLNGHGVKINNAEAFKWFKKAAEQEHSKAQCNLGYCYRYGIGAEQNETEAKMWFTRAAKQGDLRAKKALNPCLSWFFHWANSK